MLRTIVAERQADAGGRSSFCARPPSKLSVTRADTASVGTTISEAIGTRAGRPIRSSGPSERLAPVPMARLLASRNVTIAVTEPAESLRRSRSIEALGGVLSYTIRRCNLPSIHAVEASLVGRPRIHASQSQARAAANKRRHAAMIEAGMSQRTVWLTRSEWQVLRRLRRPGEVSDAAVLARLIHEAASQLATATLGLEQE